MERFVSNAEYAMLYVLKINQFKKVMHTGFICLFVCFLLCHVFRSSDLVIILVLHHSLLWLAFLRNRFWRQDSSDSSRSRSWNQNHCASFQHCVCFSFWKHDIWWKLEYCLLFKHRSIRSPPSPALPQHQKLYALFLFIENKSLMCGCTV